VDYGDVMMKMVFVIWFLFWIVMGERKILKAMDIFLSYAADQFSSPPFLFATLPLFIVAKKWQGDSVNVLI
jgi:hypothetical protein